ncbi:hypothetical protein EI983_14010 [Roseovarius faecimaris]|uniref:Uncharacterized protein n=1 Tax=Roseovarius faecimaris TaxID=2494550 RepID=A0A6I6IQF8_9RHOB|nr:hypothetical protein [Roseovarius faecimaris]QGX99319.1 hypothetical protein EI983_14010 [Roseovarius faecimaris]
MTLRMALALAALPLAAEADPDRVSILLGSHHINATRDFQEINPGVILTWQQSALGYSLGAYYNSYEDISVLGALSYGVEIAPEFELGVFGGLAWYPGEGDQFDHSIGDAVPLVGVQTRYRNAFVQLIPADGGTLDGLVTFGLTFALD